MKKILLAAIVAGALTLISCASTIALDEVYSYHERGDYGASYAELEAMRDEVVKRQGKLIYALDAGMLAHKAGMWEQSNIHFDEAQRLIFEGYTESISANLASYFVNDNSRPYQGEDYEDLYANIFKALNYHSLGETESALVELRRFSEKQQFLQDKYERLIDSLHNVESNVEPISFSTSALGNYVQMVFARDSGDVAQALFSADQVHAAFAKQPNVYPFPVPSTLESDLRTPLDGKVRMNVIAFTGKSPVKEERTERVWVSCENYQKIALPYMVARPSRVHSVEVVFSDGTQFSLERIEDISAIAMDAFRLKQQYIVTKTIARSLAKTAGTAIIDISTDVMASSASSQEEAQRIEFFGTLAGIASRIFGEASEQADVRISHFYPSLAWIGGAYLFPGTYDAHIIYRDQKGKVLYEQSLAQVVIGTSSPHLVESICPM